MLERILPDINFGEVKNTAELSDEELRLYLESYFENIETEKTMNHTPDAHGVRFDAQITGTERWAEIEMQTYTGEHIGKRSRYYLSNVDMEAFGKGKKYSDLPPTYVIFICTFDYMGDGKPVYCFPRYDKKNDLILDDETYIIVLNTKCNPEIVPEQLKSLYAYINDPGKVGDEFIQKIEQRVQQYNSPKWRSVQLTLEHEIQMQIERAIAQGLAQGHAEGHAQGQTEMQEQIARKMLQRGTPVELIAEDTGLPAERILALQAEN